MPAWCAAVGCTNYKGKNADISFFRLPPNKEIASQWLSKIKRVDAPKYIYICEKHFEESCFDPTIALKNSFRKGKI